MVDESGLTAWGERIGATIGTPAFIGLRGPLGAGKSVLARAIARGAGVTGTMPSPTFNLVLRYDGRDGRTILHVDLFRLNDPAEVWELGWSELGAPGEIALVEWPERAESLLPPARWDILIEPVADPLLRRVSLELAADAPDLAR
ncbi:MAG TPA: tRNA (adenosine(37)-N6)-threonylcarbamoyltransferase complex ATPase subunit type 1 TsaE [Longimicrobiales bacterium]|nr:tRNA (adenosine(37)-N6)-threonylcarbamoyltransferase complex ATPase subunit type 1 TsaE [Longimicrobiales bacterium]